MTKILKINNLENKVKKLEEENLNKFNTQNNTIKNLEDKFKKLEEEK